MMTFESARPIWPAGRDTEMNLLVGFRCVLPKAPGGPVTLRVAASSLYRAYLNGSFLGCGPARGPHGYYRVDEWDLSGRGGDEDILAIEVAGYNINSYYLLDQPSFLQAEALCRGEVLASTAGDGVRFEGAVLPQRVQKVQRYSFQRTFLEAYRLTPDSDAWRREPDALFAPTDCPAVADKKILPRGVPVPTFARRPPVWEIASGSLEAGPTPELPVKSRALTDIGPAYKGFREQELEVVDSTELQRLKEVSRQPLDRLVTGPPTVSIPADSYHLLDFGTNLTGFPGATVECDEPVRLLWVFDEILVDGNVDPLRLNSVNVIRYDLAPGRYELESIEPYTMRYLKLIALGGGCRVEGPYLREYANPSADRAEFVSSDRGLNELFEAARQTFRQNALDVPMDCPSRERAGWLCDSFFTGRTESTLCGGNPVERAFLENYLLPESFEHLPDGMLPMCYPADHPDGRFIPNWAMWFVLELEEYFRRTGDRETVERFEGKVRKLRAYFEGFRNDDGLLEGLESWVFVEWSKAAEFVQDVNYPSNMLYAAFLDAVGRLYGDLPLTRESHDVRQAIRRQSFDGEFFVDNAVREDGRLRVTRNRTEVCQYFAFFFGVAMPTSHERLWKMLVEDFGPDRDVAAVHPEIHKANAFVGNTLRLEILSRYHRSAQAVAESKGYCLKMARTTGTLWENDDPSGSCNHGFASHVAHLLCRDALGVRKIETVRKPAVTLLLGDLPLQWCRGRIPVGADFVTVEWWKAGGKLHYRVRVPAGLRLNVQSAGGLQLVAHP